MQRIRTLVAASVLTFGLGSLSQPVNAATVIDFGPNGNGSNCLCYDLHNGLGPLTAYEPSFLAIHMCPNTTGGWNSYTQPETQGGIGVFPSGNVVSSLPPPPAGTRRVLMCGNPPGTTPLVNYGTGTVFASYVDIPCPNGVSGQQVPAGQQPPWMTQFQGGSGWYPVCNP